MSLSPAQLLRGLAVGALVVGWALLAHLGSAGHSNADLATLLGISPAVATVGLLLWRTRHPAYASLGGLAILLLLAWQWPALRQNVSLLYFVQHCGINTAMCALFLRSLSGPGEALITRMARTVHDGHISDLKVRYTRQITAAWGLFFLGNATVSALLFFLASPQIWSVFANLLSFPLVLLMFVAEHLWRFRALPAAERPTIAQVVHAIRSRRSSVPPSPPA